MSDVDPLKALSDIASDAHTRIQAAHEHINQCWKCAGACVIRVFLRMS